MAAIWHRGQIDALSLPRGCYIDTYKTRTHIETVRNNTAYREALEKAAKIAGYVPPALTLARGRIAQDDERALFNQNEKAEMLKKAKEGYDE